MNRFFNFIFENFLTSIKFILIALLCLHFSAPYAALFCFSVALIAFVYRCVTLYRYRRGNNDFRRWMNGK
jgi:hypothetical protein